MLLLRKTPSSLSAALALALVLAAPAPVLAQRAPSDVVGGVPLSAHKIAVSAAPNIQAKAGILVSGDGRVLWSRSPDMERAMASTTKIMTALLVLTRGRLDDLATVSRTASRVQDGAGLVPGEKLSVRELLELMLVHSANDAAYVLAEHVGASEPKFIAMMNAEAHTLGLKHTHFVNPHGLDAPGHHSSAADLAALARIVMRIPEFRRIVAKRSVTVSGPNGRETFGTTDELLGSYPGIDGVKTGYTDKAGYCFVASAKRGGIGLIAVVLGTDDKAARFTQAARLLDWGFTHLKYRVTASLGQDFGAVSVTGGTAWNVVAETAEATAVPALDLFGPIRSSVALEASVVAPVFVGEPLGNVTWTQGGRVLVKLPLVAAQSADAVGKDVGAVPVADYVDRAVVARIGGVTSRPVFAPQGVVRRRMVLDPRVMAPVAEGQHLGEIIYEQGKRVVVRVPIVAGTAVATPGFLQRLETWCVRSWRGMFGGPKMAALEIKGE